jgi:hypothetical protein
MPLIIIVIIIIIVCLIVFIRSGAFKRLWELRGKTQEQKAVIKYFLASGCLASFFKMRDQEFDEILVRKVRGYNILDMALRKLNVDMSEVQEVSPVLLDNYYPESSYHKIGKDFVCRSSEYQLSCVLCASTKIYLYSFIFDLTSVSTKEHTKEYFYGDITNISTDMDIIEMAFPNGCLGFSVDRKKVERRSFRLVVPGDSFACATRSENEPQIQGMRSKLREKNL